MHVTCHTPSQWRWSISVVSWGTCHIAIQLPRILLQVWITRHGKDGSVYDSHKLRWFYFQNDFQIENNPCNWFEIFGRFVVFAIIWSEVEIELRCCTTNKFECWISMFKHRNNVELCPYKPLCKCGQPVLEYTQTRTVVGLGTRGRNLAFRKTRNPPSQWINCVFSRHQISPEGRSLISKKWWWGIERCSWLSFYEWKDIMAPFCREMIYRICSV